METEIRVRVDPYEVLDWWISKKKRRITLRRTEYERQFNTLSLLF